MKEFNPELTKFSEAERNILLSRLEAIRAAISHAGEKGRTVENDVRSLLQLVLPSRYGVATGFVAFHDQSCVSETPFPDAGEDAWRYDYNYSKDRVGVSSQLDLIIYDSILFAPIVDLGTAVVLPLESVIGYVEVKTQLQISSSTDSSSSLASVLSQSKRIRSHDTRIFSASVPGYRTKTALIPFPRRVLPHIRSFVFAFEVSGSQLEGPQLAEKMTEINNEVGGFFSGLFIADRGFFGSRFRETSDDKGANEIVFRESSAPLAAFKTSLLSSLSRFGSYPEWLNPAFHRYFSNEQTATLPTIYAPQTEGVVSILLEKSTISLTPQFTKK